MCFLTASDLKECMYLYFSNSQLEVEGDDDLMQMKSPSPKKNADNNDEAPCNSSSTPASPQKSAMETLTPQQILEVQERLLKKDSQIAELSRQLEKFRQECKRRKDSEEQMKQVLKEYEKTIGELIDEKDKEKEKADRDKMALMAEKEQSAEDLRNVEAAFADVHRKYERTKQVVESMKANEDALKAAIEEHRAKLLRQDQKYELLKSHAEETLEKANSEIENMAKSQETDVARLTALLRKTEMKTSSLERAVEQKAKENEELTQICDELIAKVGPS